MKKLIIILLLILPCLDMFGQAQLDRHLGDVIVYGNLKVLNSPSRTDLDSTTIPYLYVDSVNINGVVITYLEGDSIPNFAWVRQLLESEGLSLQDVQVNVFDSLTASYIQTDSTEINGQLVLFAESDSLASKQRLDDAEDRIEILEFPLYHVDPIMVYVDTSGNDTTGDGTSLITAYRTLNKALRSANKFIQNSLTIQLGSGEYTYTADDLVQINSFKGGGTLTLQGTMVEVSNVTLTYADGTGTVDPFVCNALVDGLDPSWTTDELIDFYIANNKYTGGLYYPILGNTSNTVEYSVTYSPGNAYGIYEQTTELAYDSELTGLNITLSNNQIITLTFNHLEFTSPAIVEIVNTTFEAYGCRFNLGTLTKDLRYAGTSITYISGCELYGGMNLNECGLSINTIQRSIFNNNDILCQSSKFKLMFSIFNGGARSIFIKGGGSNIGNNSIIDNYLKFKNVTSAIDLFEGTYTQDISPQYYILDNVTNFLDLNNGIRNLNFRGVSLDNIIGVPTSAYVIADIAENYVNPASNFYMNIGGVTFPNSEYYSELIIPNNSIAQDSLIITVGDISKNKSISIEYTLERGDSLEMGEIKLVTITTIDSVKIVHLVEYADDINMSFTIDMIPATSLQGDLINIVAKLDDTIATDAILNLGTVKRIMQ